MSNVDPIIFFIIAAGHTLFYTVWRHDIFEWNADPDRILYPNGKKFHTEARKELEEKRKIIKDEAPCAWKIEYYLHVFLGIAMGWIFLWVLIDKRIDFFSDNPNFGDLGFPDLVLFLLGWIGINGRLPSIAHSIVDFMKSGVSISAGK